MLLPLLAAGGASAEDVRPQCSATAAGTRVLADVELLQLFDPELVRLVKLGLTGEVAVELELVRPRPFWFDDRQDLARTRAQVTWSKEEQAFLLDGRKVRDLQRLPLERVSLRATETATEGFVVRVRVRLEVVTDASLREVARWVGGRPDDEKGTLFGDQLVGALVNDLARKGTAECRVVPR